MLKHAVVCVTGKVWRSQAMFLDDLLDCEEHACMEATVDNEFVVSKFIAKHTHNVDEAMLSLLHRQGVAQPGHKPGRPARLRGR